MRLSAATPQTDSAMPALSNWLIGLKICFRTHELRIKSLFYLRTDIFAYHSAIKVYCGTVVP